MVVSVLAPPIYRAERGQAIRSPSQTHRPILGRPPGQLFKHRDKAIAGRTVSRAIFARAASVSALFLPNGPAETRGLKDKARDIHVAPISLVGSRGTSQSSDRL